MARASLSLFRSWINMIAVSSRDAWAPKIEPRRAGVAAYQET